MLWRLLRTYLAPFRSQLGVVIALQVLSTTAVFLLPSLYGHVIDRGVATGDTDYILSRGAEMLGVSVFQLTASVVAVYFSARIAMGYGRDLRGAVFHHVGILSAREVAKIGAPSLITRTTNDVQQIQTLVLMLMTMFVMAPIMCVSGLIMSLREDLQLSKLLAVCIPALACSLGLIIARMIPKFRRMQPKIDALTRVLREQITGMRVVRAFVREPVEAVRFEEANADLTELALGVGKLQVMMFPIVMLVFNASQVAVQWFGANRVANDAIQVGALLAFLAYLMQILMAVMMTTFLTMIIPRAAVCAERIVEVLDIQPAIAPPDLPIKPAALTGEVELRGVEFRYSGATAPVLADLSFIARPGQVTAIIGSTGAGKTTLLELIPRLSDPTAGTVLVDGVDVKHREPEELWARIGAVPQRAYLFTGTIATNLRFGNPDANDDALWAALEVAQAKDFVEQMPQKLDAPVAQGGTNLSGGQRQRVAIARALLRAPGVFLFDDAFSALDLATEARLRAALRPRLADAAMIVVAQRIASIRDADQILVLEGGKLVGRGRHDELIASCPTYAEIVTSQVEQTEAAA
jgi:ATP-binding cassette subfamily B multidrug efflux pump